jgi:two-component system response regulator RstA
MFAAAEDRDPGSTSRCWKGSRVKRILIVGHEESTASTFRQGLVANGYEVSVVAEGSAAVARVLNEDYDLIILDIGMPNDGALDVVRALHESTATPSVLLVTKPHLLRQLLAAEDPGEAR